MNPRPWSVLVAAAAACPLAAQGAPAVSVAVISHPHASVQGTFADACVGQFRGSGYLDHAVVVDGTVWLHSMPRYGGAVEPLAGPALTGATAVTRRFRDHFSLHAGDVQRPRDELWIAHAGGLSRWWADGSGNVEPLGGAPFAGAKALLSVDLDGDGHLDLVGIAANGRDVVAAFLSGNTFVDAELQTCETNEVVYAIDSLLLDGESVRRVALATASGLWLFPDGFEGSPEQVVGRDARSGCLAPVRCQDGRETIAWVHEDVEGNDVLFVHPRPHSEVALGRLGVVGIAAGDVDGDGDDDLVLSQRLNHCASLLFDRDPAPAPFGPLDGVQLRLLPDGESAPAPDTRVRPILADMNGDGDIDIVTVTQRDRRVCLVESAIADVYGQFVLPAAGTLTFDDRCVTIDVAVAPGGAALHGYTHCEVLTWDFLYHPGEPGPGQLSASPMGSIQGLSRLPPAPLSTPTDLAFEGDLTAYDSRGGQLVLWRALEVDPVTNVVLRVGPAVGGCLVHLELIPLAASVPGAVATNLTFEESGNPPNGIRTVGWVTVEPPPPGGTTGPN